MHDGVVKPEEDRNLDHHRQAAGHRIDAVLLIERHRLLRDALAIVAMLLLQLFDLRLQLLHRFRGSEGFHGEGQHQRLDDDGEGDDAESRAAEQRAQTVQRVREEFDVLVPDWDIDTIVRFVSPPAPSGSQSCTCTGRCVVAVCRGPPRRHRDAAAAWFEVTEPDRIRYRRMDCSAGYAR